MVEMTFSAFGSVWGYTELVCIVIVLSGLLDMCYFKIFIIYLSFRIQLCRKVISFLMVVLLSLIIYLLLTFVKVGDRIHWFLVVVIL